jgi:hypothetical protein
MLYCLLERMRKTSIVVIKDNTTEVVTGYYQNARNIKMVKLKKIIRDEWRGFESR